MHTTPSSSSAIMDTACLCGGFALDLPQFCLPGHAGTPSYLAPCLYCNDSWILRGYATRDYCDRYMPAAAPFLPAVSPNSKRSCYSAHLPADQQPLRFAQHVFVPADLHYTRTTVWRDERLDNLAVKPGFVRIPGSAGAAGSGPLYAWLPR